MVAVFQNRKFANSFHHHPAPTAHQPPYLQHCRPFLALFQLTSRNFPTSASSIFFNLNDGAGKKGQQERERKWRFTLLSKRGWGLRVLAAKKKKVNKN